MKRLLVTLNLLLLVAAIGMVAHLSGKTDTTDMPARLEDLPTPDQARQPTPVDFKLGWRPLAPDRADLVVQENLFDPERTYHVAEAADKDEGDQPVEEEEDKLEFELLGLVQIGTRASATIQVKDAGGSPAPVTNRRPPRPGTPAPKKGGGKRGVVLLGKQVFDTGWYFSQLKQDELGNPVVVLTNQSHPNWKPREATLDRGDEASKARLSSAREEEAKKLAAEKALMAPPAAGNAPPADKGAVAKPADAKPDEAGSERKTPAEAIRELIQKRQQMRRLGHGFVPPAQKDGEAADKDGDEASNTNSAGETGTPSTTRPSVKTPTPPGLP